MKKNSIISGLILIAIGFTILLKTLGLLDFSWWTMLKMWPFAFIFIGISLLPVKKLWKGIFHALAIMACVATMVYVSKDNHFITFGERVRSFFDKHDLTEWKTDILESDKISCFGFSDSITHVKVDAEFISGKYHFETKPHKSLLRFSFSGNDYSTSVTEEGITGFLKLQPKEYNDCKGNGKIQLYEKIGYTFHLQGDKSDVLLNAINLKIDTLNIVANEASTWNITLSKLLPEMYLFIKAHPDAENIKLTIPSSSGYQFTTNIISDDTQWNNLQPIESGKYQSENFKDAKTRVFIESNTQKVEVRL